MTKDDIIRMAREAGIEVLTSNGMFYTQYWDGVCPDGFVAAMTLAYEAGRAAENKECAKVCDAYDVAEDVCSSDTAEGIALAIRAREQ